MNKEIIKDTLSRKEFMFNNVNFPSIATIMKFVKINLQMNRMSMDYYYEIDADELAKSKITQDILNQMKDEGWAYNDKNDTVILYLKNKN